MKINITPNPEMLILAREIRGFTQTKLAEKSGIDQGRISRYEGGVMTIQSDDLEDIAKALSFPIDFFYREGNRCAPATGSMFHRKQRTASATDQKRIDGFMNVCRLNVTTLLMKYDIESPYFIPKFDARRDFGGNIEDIAAAVREAWEIPSGHIDHLIGRLEAASCMVITFDFGTDKIDEVVQWVDPAPPVILVNSRAPGDRLRFSLAHALGHLVMHRGEIPHQDMENEADKFAAAFLMPAEDIRPELTPISIEHMLQLKPLWKVSMQSLIRRAFDIGEINERYYTSLLQNLSRAGYRKKEPMPIPPERPSQFKELLQQYKADFNCTTEDLARLMTINIDDFREWYYPETSHPHLKLLETKKRSAG